MSVETQTTGTGTEQIDYNNSLRVVNTIGDLVTQDVVLSPVAKEYNVNLDSLRKKVSTKVSSTSFMITISVIDRDIELAQKYTDSIVESLIDVTEADPAIKVLNVKLSQVGKATPGKYNSPNKTLYLLVSFAGGLILSCLACCLMEFASSSFRNIKEVEERYEGLTVIGKFYDDKTKEEQSKKDKKRHHPRLVEKNLRELEPYNTLLSNIYYSNPENPYKSILITSPQPLNLKSMIAANLAFAASNNGKKAIIIDFDVRKPTTYKTFHVSKDIGLIDYIAGTKTEEEIIKHTTHGVDIITGGSNIINPMVLVSSEKIKTLIESLKEKYDYVFVDTPPTTVCNDAFILSKNVDGVLLNISMVHTKKSLADDSIKKLNFYDAKLIGLNLTHYPTNDHRDHYYYYNKGYYSSDNDNNVSNN